MPPTCNSKLLSSGLIHSRQNSLWLHQIGHSPQFTVPRIAKSRAASSCEIPSRLTPSSVFTTRIFIITQESSYESINNGKVSGNFFPSIKCHRKTWRAFPQLKIRPYCLFKLFVCANNLIYLNPFLSLMSLMSIFPPT